MQYLEIDVRQKRTRDLLLFITIVRSGTLLLVLYIIAAWDFQHKATNKNFFT
jgi:hypothetical protein